ncbi:SNF2 helicase-associated domain-containing protein [Streptomyces sp. NPDC007808]|uniref:SNF2 helicase-associated domain-containing protein n=1 Tax=Streptomyces sp. NPDC007808 TaxID=3364779 RepID=UPI00367E65AF
MRKADFWSILTATAVIGSRGGADEFIPGSAFLALNRLVDCRWHISLDGDPLTEDEMTVLADVAWPLIGMRGRWLLVVWSSGSVTREVLEEELDASSQRGDHMRALHLIGRILGRVVERHGAERVDYPGCAVVADDSGVRASQTAQLAGFSPTGSRPPSSGGPRSVPFAISATKVRLRLRQHHAVPALPCP